MGSKVNHWSEIVWKELRHPSEVVFLYFVLKKLHMCPLYDRINDFHQIDWLIQPMFMLDIQKYNLELKYVDVIDTYLAASLIK